MPSPHSRPHTRHTTTTLRALQDSPHLYHKAQLFLTQQPTLPHNTRHGHDGYTLGPFMPQHIHGFSEKTKSYKHPPTTSNPSHGYDSLAKYSCCGPKVPQPSPTSFNTSIHPTPQSNSLANSYTVKDIHGHLYPKIKQPKQDQLEQIPSTIIQKSKRPHEVTNATAFTTCTHPTWMSPEVQLQL